jgi:hypothetical protein
VPTVLIAAAETSGRIATARISNVAVTKDVQIRERGALDSSGWVRRRLSAARRPQRFLRVARDELAELFR